MLRKQKIMALLVLCSGFWLQGFAIKKSKVVDHEVIIRTDKETICARVLNAPLKFRTKPDRFYWGYYQGIIFIKQGVLQGKPLNGHFSRYDNKGNILETGFFKNGLKSGNWKSLTPDGNLIENISYHKGLKHGMAIIYKNGKVKEKYKNGKLAGKQIKETGKKSTFLKKLKEKK